MPRRRFGAGQGVRPRAGWVPAVACDTELTPSGCVNGPISRRRAERLTVGMDRMLWLGARPTRHAMWSASRPLRRRAYGPAKPWERLDAFRAELAASSGHVDDRRRGSVVRRPALPVDVALSGAPAAPPVAGWPFPARPFPARRPSRPTPAQLVVDVAGLVRPVKCPPGSRYRRDPRGGRHRAELGSLNLPRC
jgi:hypothetical protein